MTYTIELDRSIEQALEAKARRRGLGLDAYLRDLAERDAATECATEHNTASGAPQAAQPLVLSSDRATRSAQLAALLHAPPQVREATLAAGAAALADDYANDPELTEMMIELLPDKSNGLSKPSAADASQIRVVDLSRFGGQLGQVSPSELTDITNAAVLCLGYTPPVAPLVKTPPAPTAPNAPPTAIPSR